MTRPHFSPVWRAKTKTNDSESSLAQTRLDLIAQPTHAAFVGMVEGRKYHSPIYSYLELETLERQISADIAALSALLQDPPENWTGAEYRRLWERCARWQGLREGMREAMKRKSALLSPNECTSSPTVSARCGGG